MTQLINSHYQQNVQQLKLLYEQGPSHVRITEGLFKALAPNMSHAPISLHEVMALAEQKVAQINLAHQTMAADSADRDHYFDNAEFIATWNRNIGQSQIWQADAEKFKITYQGSLPISIETPLAKMCNFSFIKKEQLSVVIATPKNLSASGDLNALLSDQNLRNMRNLLSSHPAIVLRGFNVNRPEGFKFAFEQFVSTTDEVLSQNITNEIKKTDLWSRYQGQTLHYTSSYSAQEWVSLFGADKAEAEKRCGCLGTCQWQEDGSLKVLFVAPVTKEIGGIELWYNQINLLANAPDQNVTLSDGSPIPQKDVEQINAIKQKVLLQASFKWERDNVFSNCAQENPSFASRHTLIFPILPPPPACGPCCPPRIDPASTPPPVCPPRVDPNQNTY